MKRIANGKNEPDDMFIEASVETWKKLASLLRELDVSDFVYADGIDEDVSELLEAICYP